MGKPTKTRAELRRTIGVELGLEFYRRFPDSGPLATGAGSSAFTDSTHVLGEDYWNEGWMYIAVSSTGPQGEFRKITDYSSDGIYYLEYGFSSEVAIGDEYEITEVYTPGEIHKSIDRAIEDSFPSFYDVINDETLIIEYEKLSYDLTGLSSRPWNLLQVEVERNNTALYGICDSATATTLTDSDGEFSDVESGWLLSIYRGTGTGQLRTVSSATSTTITIPTWTTNPDSTSYYVTWNPSEETNTWRRLMAIRQDQKQYPSYLYLTDNYAGVHGMRIRLRYSTKPASLSADSDVTVVPQEYVINKSLAFLTAARVNHNAADRSRYESLEDRYHAKAEVYRKNNAWRQPDVNLWMESEDGTFSNWNDANPLNW